MIVKAIKEYLFTHGIKQTWLAEQLGIPNTTLSGIMNGRSELKAEMFIRICEILDEPLERFTEGRTA